MILEKDSIPCFQGDYLIPVNQAKSNYITHVLEPQSVDGFFNWNFFQSIVLDLFNFPWIGGFSVDLIDFPWILIDFLWILIDFSWMCADVRLISIDFP